MVVDYGAPEIPCPDTAQPQTSLLTPHATIAPLKSERGPCRGLPTPSWPLTQHRWKCAIGSEHDRGRFRLTSGLGHTSCHAVVPAWVHHSRTR